MARYKVKSDWKYMGLEDSYEEGAAVRFYVPLATDTNYNCTVNGEYLSPSVENGFLVYTFLMPDCDTEIKVETKNTMYRIMCD